MLHRLTVLALLVAGCSGSTSATGEDAGPAVVDAGLTNFIALGSDFQDFRQWSESVFYDDAGTGVGTREVWINHRPEHGATEFPIGTIIVKQEDDATTSVGYALHAMVKRGRPFNSSDGGAAGWEWFELDDTTNPEVTIAWRGITPPDGGGYSGIAGGTCNSCHGAKADNDYVRSPTLQLKDF